jgi:hypothetical protein
MKNEDIENLINLELIYLVNNPNIKNDDFKKLNKIKILILHDTKITSYVLKYLPNIEIWQPNNTKTEDNYEYLKNIKKLKLLDLNYNQKIFDEHIKNINVEHIILSDKNNITINALNKNIKRIDIIRKFQYGK